MSRIPEQCKHCAGPAIVYCTVHGETFITRYRRCRSCGQSSKSVSVNPVLFSRHIEHNEANSEIMRPGSNLITHGKD